MEKVMSAAKMKVAISGAGLAGLCLAHRLLSAGFEVSVFEREMGPDHRKQGYRITCDEHGIGALASCLPRPLFDAVLATASVPSSRDEFRIADRRLIPIVALRFDHSADKLPRQIDRQMLRHIMLSGLGDSVRFGKEAIDVVQTDELATLVFSDGSTAKADLIVVADGIGSRIKHQTVPNRSRDLGWAAIYGRSPLGDAGGPILEEPLDRSGLLAVNANRKAFFSTAMRFGDPPVAAMTRLRLPQPPNNLTDYIMWALLFRSDEAPARGANEAELQQFLLRQLSDFHPKLRRLVQGFEPGSLVTVSMKAASRPADWAVSRVTAIGDAVHVMPPLGAHGGNTALRDARTLGTELAEFATGRQTLAEAVGNYQQAVCRYGIDAVDESVAMLERVSPKNAILRWLSFELYPGVKSWFVGPLQA